MSDFSNRGGPVGDVGGRSQAYVRAVLERVGEREPLGVLRATAGELARIVEARPHERLGRAEAPGKWSAAGVVQHLADAEVAWGWRIRQVLTVERPVLEGYDQDAWGAAFGYERAVASRGLELFRAARAGNLALVERCGPTELARVGLHSERGAETLAHMVRLNAGHDLVHLDQLERILAATPRLRAQRP